MKRTLNQQLLDNARSEMRWAIENNRDTSIIRQRIEKLQREVVQEKIKSEAQK